MTTTTDPLTLRTGLTIPDRVGMAPLTNTQSHSDGTLSDDEFKWLVRRARGGFRWISTCAAYVSDEGKAWDGQLGVATDAHLPGLTRLATALREAGAVSVVQLHHGGKKAEQAPRKLSTIDDDSDGTRGATQADIERVIADFVAAAERAERAGFDGVEIHGANGYLITQFLAPLDNPRTDAYGGDLAGRARFAREVTRAVRAAVSPSFVVGIRLSPVDSWSQRGLVLSDTLQVVQWLAQDGLDFVHLSMGDASGTDPAAPDGPPIVRQVRDVLPSDVALLSVGGVWSREDAQRALDAGADMAILGRAVIGNPDWAERSKDPSWQAARPPWTEQHLRDADVGEALIRYIKPFSGLVVGGTPSRS